MAKTKGSKKGNTGGSKKKDTEKGSGDLSAIATDDVVEAARDAGQATENVVHATEEDAVIHSIIDSADKVDEEEWEKRFLDIKSRGNYFDLVRNMYPFQLPEVCERKQKAHINKYFWVARENMEMACDPSKLIYKTPVNRSNHPDLPPTSFNRNGGLCREGLYLCYMPWKMYEARCEIQREMSRIRYEEQDDIFHKATAEAEHYKPEEGQGGAVTVAEADITHRGRIDEDLPPETFEESGEYEE